MVYDGQVIFSWYSSWTWFHRMFIVQHKFSTSTCAALLQTTHLRYQIVWNCHEPSQPLSQLYPTPGQPCPNGANPGDTLPQWTLHPCISITMIPYSSITTFCYLVTLLSLVSSSPLLFLVLIVLPQVTLYTYPRYLGSLPCTHYLILDITNAPLTCSSVPCLSSLSPGGALLSVVVLCGWVSSSQLRLSLAPILLLT